ncbi:GNAT family N-acetyltransferase [Streptomyces sp. BI20]|uniref:GNAT family N-acetyltransferase n=1 Tax=Streptomyces sp. BI20 TaxID=3403460 RepID=UPI003C7100DA
MELRMTPTFPDVTISTDRLVLRPFEAADVPTLTELMNDELVTAWTDTPHPCTAADAHAFVTLRAPAARATGRGLVLAVTEFLTGRLVGLVTLRGTDWRVRSTEADVVTAPWARGEGYAGEALLALAHWLFTARGFERVELRTAAENTAGQQIAQKIGAISEGVLRGAGMARVPTVEGGWSELRTDLILWGLLPEDLDDPDALDTDEPHVAWDEAPAPKIPAGRRPRGRAVPVERG